MSITTHGPEPRALPGIRLRRPTIADAVAIHQLVVRSPPLDVNSVYAYLLWCRDFAATSVVAVRGNRLAGFVTGYRPPRDPATYFAWQSAVDPALTRPGLAFAMMTEVADRARRTGARFFETTVNPGNRAVVMLVRKLARHYGGAPEVSTLFESADLGGDHEPEVRYRFPLPAPGIEIDGTG
ncbi:diaminobutyrate acetyltransferase [Amycolatopsis australiensis]|uniref:L-2,4-diaminobutyric acid acetyltransferase n=1 Tax=Amycolatopsis australiensis TaxID=546364 RepID=A0A1K1SAP6_9PSEU|nr:diaminobutyrate acetyltransferase [Amycolatopsis australiensis]SFW81427.1 diaminobutyrate acetyltransferase [Amycolatopsis australiensis]